MAARVPTVADVNPRELAATAPASSREWPTAAAVPKPPTKPTGSIMPNQSSVPKKGLNRRTPRRMNRPHWPRNMPVEYDHIWRAPVRTEGVRSMPYAIDAKTKAMRMPV